MRFVYVDEAGTSAKEPWSVVAGVIIDADQDWLAADRAVRDAIKEHVPAHYRTGFIFHAKTIWGDKRYREGWSQDERVALIKAILRIPYELRLPFAMGSCSREIEPYTPVSRKEVASINHAFAFGLVAALTDDFMRETARPHEVATIVAEDCPEMRSHLKDAITSLREDPMFVPATSQVTVPGSKPPVDRHLMVTRIVDTVHFAAKTEAPLLQIADACAFAFRRLLAGQELGEELISTLMHEPVTRDMFPGPTPCGLYRWAVTNG